MTESRNRSPLALAIADNCQRLLADANALLQHGSAGSALSLAILAFEEAGKGYTFEFEAKKSKRVRSWHHYRHFMGAHVLFASYMQKHGLPLPEWSDEAKATIAQRLEATSTLAEYATMPTPDIMYAEARPKLIAHIESMDDDDRTIAAFEVRWVSKIVRMAAAGEIEALRQKGMYVDAAEGVITSTPADVARDRAYFWTRAAERLLRLFMHGDYRQPYSEVAELLQQAPRPLPKGRELLAAIQRFVEANRPQATA